jgi:hypothetical protein
MLGYLETHASEERATNVRTVRTDGRDLPAQVPDLAGAWSVLTFQHLPASQQRRYLSGMASLLKSGAPLVVQFVEGADEGPLSHPVDSLEMWEWVDEAGLEGAIEQGSRKWPTWRWLHATKR